MATAEGASDRLPPWPTASILKPRPAVLPKLPVPEGLETCPSEEEEHPLGPPRQSKGGEGG